MVIDQERVQYISIPSLERSPVFPLPGGGVVYIVVMLEYRRSPGSWGAEIGSGAAAAGICCIGMPGCTGDTPATHNKSENRKGSRSFLFTASTYKGAGCPLL